MKQSLPDLVHAVRRALGEAVLPELASDHARGQLAGVLDILGKLERMVVWSPEALGEQLRLLREGSQAFAARLREEGIGAPAFDEPVGVSVEAALHAAEEHVMVLTDWLFDPANGVAPGTRADLERILQQALRQALIIERKLIPLTDFTAMSSASEAGKP